MVVQSWSLETGEHGTQVEGKGEMKGHNLLQGIVFLPNCLKTEVLSDLLVPRYEGHTLCHCGCVGKLNSDGSDFRGDWHDDDSGTSQDILDGAFHRSLTAKDSPREQQSQFPHCNA
jgi:hypothetical protein